VLCCARLLLSTFSNRKKLSSTESGLKESAFDYKIKVAGKHLKYPTYPTNKNLMKVWQLKFFESVLFVGGFHRRCGKGWVLEEREKKKNQKIPKIDISIFSLNSTINSTHEDLFEFPNETSRKMFNKTCLATTDVCLSKSNIWKVPFPEQIGEQRDNRQPRVVPNNEVKKEFIWMSRHNQRNEKRQQWTTTVTKENYLKHFMLN